MLDGAFARATLPLFEAGDVDAIEWSFDTAWRDLPDWADALLAAAAAEGRLYGHGVHYSPLSAADGERQRAWLDELGGEVARRAYRHVSEHFGYSTAGDVVRGAPMPVPFCTAAVATGRRAIAAIAERARTPVGIENLALALSRRDVLEQGAFVAQLVPAEPDGFVLLDLHNLWCQAVNFEIAPAALLATWPLDRVRELHVSGGRWATPASDPRPFRRDTHDHPVPDEVIALLPLALASCPHVEVVIVERLGTTFATARDDDEFRDDVRRVRAAVRSPRPPPIAAAPLAQPAAIDAAALAAYQRALVTLAHSAPTPVALREALLADRALAALHEYIATLELRGLETAMELSDRWAVDATLDE